MSTERLIFATTGLVTAAGAPVTLTLGLALTADQLAAAIEIDRIEVLPHKQLRTTVLRAVVMTDIAATLARAMTTIVHELDRLHRQGYWLRERSVGMRGIWHNDLCHPHGYCVRSWQTVPKRPQQVVEALAAALAALDLPVAREQPPDRGQVLESIMRERSAEVVRDHEIDAYLAGHPLGSADELIAHLDHEHLLDSAEGGY